jgi:hypothetical protein
MSAKAPLITILRRIGAEQRIPFAQAYEAALNANRYVG